MLSFGVGRYPIPVDKVVEVLASQVLPINANLAKYVRHDNHGDPPAKNSGRGLSGRQPIHCWCFFPRIVSQPAGVTGHSWGIFGSRFRCSSCYPVVRELVS